MDNQLLYMFVREWGMTKTAQVLLSAIACACVGFIASSTFIKNESENKEYRYED